MKYLNTIKTYPVTKGGIVFQILDSGDVRNITKDNVQINLLTGTNLEGSASNLYLRLFEDDKIYYTRLIGINSPSRFYVEDNQVYYKGEFRNLQYTVVLTVLKNIWFWTIEVVNHHKNNQTIDIIYGQDVGLAHPGSILSNEAYVCQYLDHRVFTNELGYTVCTRQNQGVPHYLQQGSLTKTVGYATDGFQFFGLDYKLTNEPQALFSDQLENRNYQYEFAYTSLQSERINLSDKATFIFYGLYEDSIYEVSEDIRYFDKVVNAYKGVVFKPFDEEKSTQLQLSININNVLTGLPLDNDEINKLYSEKRHIEKDQNYLLSFFVGNYIHVVLQSKERLVERPHGHMLLNGDSLFVRDNILSSTNYIFGVFNCHVVVGNTNFHKFLSNIRNPLNVKKITGQRLFVKINDEYKLLGVPSVYELGLNYAKWVYKFDDDILTITSMIAYDRPEQILLVESEKGKKYQFLLTNHLVLGSSEYETPFLYEVHNKEMRFYPDLCTLSASKYPNLTYKLISTHDFTYHFDERFFTDQVNRHEPLVVLEFNDTDKIELRIQGLIDGKDLEVKPFDLQGEEEKFRKFIDEVLNHFHLEINNERKEEIDTFNDLARWYCHNALIHYASPHGLEQYNGAAWGTRDVCQGPAELFMVTQKFAVIRDIICKVYQREFIQNGDFPQWFMFDKYYSIFAHDSHGDIIVWPLRLLAMYLLATKDYTILDEVLPYLDRDKGEFTELQETLYDHIRRQIKAIIDSFIPGTSLSCYGGGDWDDTLQPANKALTKQMVSGWTVALTYEAFMYLQEALKEYDAAYAQELKELTDKIRFDFNKYLIRNGIPAGFILFDKNIKYILHPEDKETGVSYRLLPFNRGFISEIFANEQVEPFYQLIEAKFKHLDGVRLMDRPVQYKGGINTYFTRAETAANFGREIGLLYVHAHIRYIEAMAKVGKAKDAYEGLLKVNPINIQDYVPNAIPRQSNTYFSSSDGNFYDRYEARRDFDKLKTGEIGVKGGWRIYSSGPGIYLNQLIANVLGIRTYQNDLVLDPVLPKELDGLTFTYRFNGKPLKIYYHIHEERVKRIVINGKEVAFKRLENKYRLGGALIDRNLLNDEENIIDVYM